MDRYTSNTLKQNLKHCVDAWSDELLRTEYWKMYDRLAAYEDTGLTPEDILRLNDFSQSQCAKLLMENGRLEAKALELDNRIADLIGIYQKAIVDEPDDRYFRGGRDALRRLVPILNGLAKWQMMRLGENSMINIGDTVYDACEGIIEDQKVTEIKQTATGTTVCTVGPFSENEFDIAIIGDGVFLSFDEAQSYCLKTFGRVMMFVPDND